MIRLFIILMLLTTPAYAYLDSGTGSMIIQMLFAAVAGFLAMLKVYWQKVKKIAKSFCDLIKGKKEDKSQPSQDEKQKHDQTR